MFGGPLGSLYFMGFFPCCQKEEDKSAREALTQLNAMGARILWHRDGRAQLVGNIKKAAFSLFKKDVKVDNDPIVKAEFRLADSKEDGIPEIRINKRGIVMEDAEGKDWDFGLEEQSEKDQKSQKNDTTLQIAITLKRIHTVVPSPQDGLISLNILTDDGQNTKEWAKFGLESKDQGVMTMFCHHLQVLMEWDKQRRTECGELEHDETSAASSLRTRAKKAAHFASREIEMRSQRREREERKAKYVQESGGLKYTALAMARNATVT